MDTPEFRLRLPDWLVETIAATNHLTTGEERMRFAIGLARENVERATGGPFGAAVFETGTGRLVAAGVNLVVPQRCSVLHAEVVAIMLAQRRLDTYTLGAAGMPAHELVTSCEPCAMCLGATLWSGVTRLVCAAGREDAESLAFDEGPVFPESYAYLGNAGIEVVRGVLRDEARAVLDLYAARSGEIYNA